MDRRAVATFVRAYERREEHRDNGTVMLPTSALHASDSPRLAGESSEHIRMLAESDTELPPILVHRATMRVIDGMHRLNAAVLRGADVIEARFFEGDETEAFVLGVVSNIAHGLPLSLADRKAATVRIIKLRPQWSDRKIASIVGLAAKTVAALRRSAATQNNDSAARVGQDGRVRPLSSAAGRRRASELLVERPGASLRDIAREAGISPETVRDVRQRLRKGEKVVPAPRSPLTPRLAENEHKGQASSLADATTPRDTVDARTAALRSLKKDPSLRFNEAGRKLLRLLDAHLMAEQEWEQLVDNVPEHCGNRVLDMARECAAMWQELVGRLERGGHTSAQ